VVTSQYVIDEASAGDATLAHERLRALEGIPLLSLNDKIVEIADEILSRAILPSNAEVDALHIAMTAHHRVQYLLTWNCRHIANARILPRVHKSKFPFQSFAPHNRWWMMMLPKEPDTKTTDTIIDEIHQIRAKISAKFNGDISAIVADARKRQEADGRPVWRGPGEITKKPDENPLLNNE